MADSAIPVDLRNPGQVFACLGLVEAAETLLGSLVESVFEGDRGSTHATFKCSSAEHEPVREVIRFLRTTYVTAITPESRDLSAEKWSVKGEERSDRFYPCSVPRTPATLPARLSDGVRTIMLSSWADGPSSGRDNVKFWAGSGGYPGVALARDMLESVAALSDIEAERAVVDPFACTAPMTNSFRFDWRRDYIPLDAGFSPNKQGDVTMVGYPLTEMLAAIGLQHARPTRPMRPNKLFYRYGVWTERLPTILARPVLGTIDIGVPMRTFLMKLGWPGQANQARCIIDAREET